jgi:hypothetical protein
MLTLSGIIGLYIAGVIIGKRRERISGGSIVVLLLIAIAQTCAIMYDMLSRMIPSH